MVIVEGEVAGMVTRLRGGYRRVRGATTREGGLELENGLLLYGFGPARTSVVDVVLEHVGHPPYKGEHPQAERAIRSRRYNSTLEGRLEPQEEQVRRVLCTAGRFPISIPAAATGERLYGGISAAAPS